MYASRPPTASGGKGALKGNKGAGDDFIPLYDEDELDVLRDELLEAFSTPREKMSTRDEVTERKRTEYYVMKEEKKAAEKQTRDAGTVLKLKAKQQALLRLYENVLTEKKEKKKRRTKQARESASTGSFHMMYTVYHDPVSGNKAKMLRGDEKDAEGAREEAAAVKVIDTKALDSPSVEEEIDNLSEEVEMETLGRERSKFVLKHPLSRKSKPPALLEGRKSSRVSSTDMQEREDARYSLTEERYSFDVDVAGPFYSTVPVHQKPQKVRTVATQVMMVDGVRKSEDVEVGSQTEIGNWDGRKFSGASDGTEKSGKKLSGRKWDRPEDFYDFEEDEDEEEAGGDAWITNDEAEDEGKYRDVEGDDGEGMAIVLERKESKRREAETMARPRGYRDLDLREQIPFVTFEAETHVTAHDLDREQAKRRGISLSKDNILWPTFEEFDIDTATRKIEDYIKRCWTLDPRWLFVIRPLDVYHDNYHKKYIYEVKFSIPTPTVPVPPATASVFFTFEIPMYSLKDDSVNVTFVLEGTRFAHAPGKLQFQDKWLWNIISDKLRVQKAIDF